MPREKIGIIILTFGAIVIFVLLGILLFVTPTPKANPPDTFKGPTTPPYVNGPKDIVPQY